DRLLEAHDPRPDEELLDQDHELTRRETGVRAAQASAADELVQAADERVHDRASADAEELLREPRQSPGLGHDEPREPDLVDLGREAVQRPGERAQNLLGARAG